MTTISPQGDLDVTFLAAKTAAGQVRMLVEMRLAGWGLSKVTDDVSLIASELVTNASAPRGALLYPRLSREELKGGSWA